MVCAFDRRIMWTKRSINHGGRGQRVGLLSWKMQPAVSNIFKLYSQTQLGISFFLPCTLPPADFIYSLSLTASMFALQAAKTPYLKEPNKMFWGYLLVANRYTRSKLARNTKLRASTRAEVRSVDCEEWPAAC